jgi:hypothetical protein
MNDVTEPQRASDDLKPEARLDAQNAESPSALADPVEEPDKDEEADLVCERLREPVAGPPPGVTKGIVYW